MPAAFDANLTTGYVITTGTTSASMSATKPSAVVSGDYVVAVLSCRAATAPTSSGFPDQSGFTTIASAGNSSTASRHVWAGYKKIDGAEGATFSLDWSSIGGTWSNSICGVFRVTGADPSTFLDTAVEVDTTFQDRGGSVWSLDPASVTTTTADALVVGLYMGKPGNLLRDTDAIFPTSQTKVYRGGQGSWTASTGAQIALSYEAQAVAGATGAKRWDIATSSGLYGGAYNFAIRSAATGLSITSVDTDNAVLAGQSQATFAGAGLASTAKFAVKRGSAIAYATDISLSGSTGGSFTAPTMTAMFSAGVRFGDVAFYAAETSGTAIASISGSITTATNWKYVNVTDLSATGSMGSLFYGNAVSLSDQVAYSSVTTRFRWPVTVSGDGYFTVNSSGSQAGDEFAYRIWDETDSTWGTEGTIEVNGGISSAEQVYAAGSLVQASLESSTLEGATLQ